MIDGLNSSQTARCVEVGQQEFKSGAVPTQVTYEAGFSNQFIEPAWKDVAMPHLKRELFELGGDKGENVALSADYSSVYIDRYIRGVLAVLAFVIKPLEMNTPPIDTGNIASVSLLDHVDSVVGPRTSARPETTRKLLGVKRLTFVLDVREVAPPHTATLTAEEVNIVKDDYGLQNATGTFTADGDATMRKTAKLLGGDHSYDGRHNLNRRALEFAARVDEILKLSGGCGKGHAATAVLTSVILSLSSWTRRHLRGIETKLANDTRINQLVASILNVEPAQGDTTIAATSADAARITIGPKANMARYVIVLLKAAHLWQWHGQLVFAATALVVDERGYSSSRRLDPNGRELFSHCVALSYLQDQNVRTGIALFTGVLDNLISPVYGNRYWIGYNGVHL
jgi:hypothetical protein